MSTIDCTNCGQPLARYQSDEANLCEECFDKCKYAYGGGPWEDGNTDETVEVCWHKPDRRYGTSGLPRQTKGVPTQTVVRKACCAEMGFVLDPDSGADFQMLHFPKITSLNNRDTLHLSDDTQRIVYCPWCRQKIDSWLNPKPKRRSVRDMLMLEFLPPEVQLSRWKAALDIIEKNPDYDINRFVTHVKAIMGPLKNAANGQEEPRQPSGAVNTGQESIHERIEREFMEILEDKRLTLVEPFLPVECDQLTLSNAVAVHLYKLLQVAEHPSTNPAGSPSAPDS